MEKKYPSWITVLLNSHQLTSETSNFNPAIKHLKSEARGHGVLQAGLVVRVLHSVYDLQPNVLVARGGA